MLLTCMLCKCTLFTLIVLNALELIISKKKGYNVVHSIFTYLQLIVYQLPKHHVFDKLAFALRVNVCVYEKSTLTLRFYRWSVVTRKYVIDSYFQTSVAPHSCFLFVQVIDARRLPTNRKLDRVRIETQIL